MRICKSKWFIKSTVFSINGRLSFNVNLIFLSGTFPEKLFPRPFSYLLKTKLSQCVLSVAVEAVEIVELFRLFSHISKKFS